MAVIDISRGNVRYVLGSQHPRRSMDAVHNLLLELLLHLLLRSHLRIISALQVQLVKLRVHGLGRQLLLLWE